MYKWHSKIWPQKTPSFQIYAASIMYVDAFLTQETQEIYQPALYWIGYLVNNIGPMPTIRYFSGFSQSWETVSNWI